MAGREKGSIPGDIHFKGVLSADKIDYPDAGIRNEHLDPTSLIDNELTQKQFNCDVRQPGTVVNRTETIHVATGAGDILGIDAGMIVPPTLTATVTIDLLKNGVTILSSPLVIDNTAVTRTMVTTGIADDAVAVDDWFDVQVTIATPTGVIGSGLFIRVKFREEPG